MNIWSGIKAGGVVAVAAAAISLLLPGNVWAQGKKFEGVTITYGAPLNAPTRNIMKFLDQFKEETGITVVVEGMSNDDLNARLTVESVAKTGFFDLVRVSPHWISRLKEAGWIVPLDDRIANSDIDLDDFFDSALNVLSRIPGDDAIWAMPLDANTGMLAYRTDLFNDPKEKAAFKKKYGYDLAPPTDTDQWLEMAEFFTRDTDGDGEADLFGLGVGQKVGGPAFIWSLGPFWSFGGEIMNEETNEILVNSPAAVAGMKWQLAMQKFQPKSSLAWGIYDNVGPMQAGRLAMSVQLFSFTKDLLDPEKSEFHDRIAFTTLPVAKGNGRGYTTGKYVFGGGGVVLHADSENKDAAFEFLSWMFGKERAPEYAIAGTLVPRKSVMENPAVLDSSPAFKKTLPVFLASLKTVAKGRPSLPESGQLLRELSAAWHAVALGKATPEEALAKAQSNMEEIIEDAGYN